MVCLLISSAEAKRTGEADADAAGGKVAGAGDVDGDGYDDVLVGAHGDDTGGTLAGAVYLVLGPMSGTASLATADAKFVGEEASDAAGDALAGAGAAARHPQRRPPAQGRGGAHEGRGRAARRAGRVPARSTRNVARAVRRAEDGGRQPVAGAARVDRRAARPGLPRRGVPRLAGGARRHRGLPGHRRRRGAAAGGAHGPRARRRT